MQGVSIDFEKELAGIAAMVPPEHELAPETIPIAAKALEDVDRRYGPNSQRPLPFHNAPHSIGVTRRAVRMGNILLPYIPPPYRDNFFDLSIINGSTHDYDQDSDPGDNESNSAVHAVGLVENADGVLNNEDFKKRIPLGIMATLVEMKEDGELVQTNLQIGAHDPIKFSMGFSDINGIAMEGSKRMWRDATNLYYEINPEPSIEGLYGFLVNQAGFLRQRLNDGRVKADIAYYFADHIGEVYNDMHKAFHANIISAYNLAVLLGKHPELKQVIGAAAKGIDRSRVGSMAGKLLTRKLAADQ
jgi:hypothetical protein